MRRTQLFITSILFITAGIINAQDYQWCFGDSAGIDFSNPNNPVAFHSAVKSRGSCASVCDTAGNLLFYTAYDADGFSGGNPLNGEVYNRDHNLMLNGNYKAYGIWYQEVTVIPDPGDINQYYIFCVGVTTNNGLSYSKVDMTLDSSRGAVTSKNVVLQAAAAVDGLFAIQHGNGRDWWIYYRHTNPANNEFIRYLVTPLGVLGPYSQSVGSNTQTNLIRYFANKAGDKIAGVGYDGYIELFDIDRCSGLFSSSRVIQPYTPVGIYNGLVGAEFSPSGQFLYLNCMKIQQTSQIIQLNLSDPFPIQTANTIYQYTTPVTSGGEIRRAINDKLYWSCIYYDGVTSPYPYNDTLYNTYNTNLSVINSPDSLGVACDFQPFSFYLGGSRTYFGLPDNPNRMLGAVTGSLCDTLTVGMMEINQPENIHLFPNPAHDIFYVSCNLTEVISEVMIYNYVGQEIDDVLINYSQSNMAEVKCSGLKPGVYYVQCRFNNEVAKTNKVVIY